MKTTYDFIVIGGGSGGIAAARRAAVHGASAMVVESARLGGTCVNVGCVPKKVMWNAAQINESLHLAGDYGWSVTRDGAGDGQLDWASLKRARDAYIARLNTIYADNLTQSGVAWVEGRARFSSPHSIRVNDTEYHAPHILIATGGQSHVPPVPGAELGITSNGFFALPQQPKKILVIGAGYIATELAGMLHALGSEVTMLLRGAELLRPFDHDLHTLVMSSMQASGVTMLKNVALTDLYEAAGLLGVHYQDDQHCHGFDTIIWATGRKPDLADLDLATATVSVDARGYVTTDEYQNTSADGIYAVGDVTARLQLTPVAIAAGRRLADRVFGGEPTAKLDYSKVPTVVFSHPPIGTVGLSEQNAIAEYGAENLKIYKNTFVDIRYALSEHRPRTLVKLITQGRDETIVGCHICGHSADEIIQGFAVAVKMGATKADFDNTVAIHPIAAEELVTLR